MERVCLIPLGSGLLFILGGAIHFLVEIGIVITTNFQQMAVNFLKEGASFSNSHKVARNL